MFRPLLSTANLVILVLVMPFCLACKKNKNTPAPGVFNGTYLGVYYKEKNSTGTLSSVNVQVRFSGSEFRITPTGTPQQSITFNPDIPGTYRTRGSDSIFMEQFSPVSALYSHNFKFSFEGDSVILSGWRGDDVYEFLRMKKQ